MSAVITRAQWGAQYRAGFGSRKVGSLDKWLHHSVTASAGPSATFDQDAATIRTLERIGQSRFGGGISYTFAITEAGRVFEGTGVDRIGAHTAGRNTGSAGIVLVGNYQDREPTAAQQAALVWLLQHGKASGWWQVAGLNGGHRDVKSTACPGDAAYRLIPAINARAGGAAVPVSNPAPSRPAAPDTRPRNADGSLRLTVDGVRGPATIARWQEVLGTPIDGRIDRPSTLIRADQAMLNRLLQAGDLRNLVGGPLAVDGLEGAKTIKARQFWLFNRYGSAVLGRGARLADFDGVNGPVTNRLHQYALNAAKARSGRY